MTIYFILGLSVGVLLVGIICACERTHGALLIVPGLFATLNVSVNEMPARGTK